jgi:RsiW-degrading membrane proteinase PrsW (M82 family)
VIGIELAAYVVCAAAAVSLVYRYDLYDREPWPLVVATASAGAVVMWWLSGFQDAVIARLAGASASPYPLALVAAATEEPARLLIVLALAVLAPRFFNDPMDGLVYGSIAGIGMALEETWAILSQSSAPSPFLPVELVRVSGHLVLGGITGFGVGVAKRPGVSTRRWVTALAACLAGSMLLHFLWDVAALTQTLSGGLSRWPALAGSVVMLVGMVVYGALVVTGARWSRQTFAPNSLRTLWGWPLVRVRQRTR